MVCSCRDRIRSFWCGGGGRAAGGPVGRLAASLFAGAVLMLFIGFAIPAARLRRTDVFQTPLMRLRVREAAVAGKRLEVQNRWVPLNAISPVLVQAVICHVDKHFFLHRGIDWDRIERAWRYNRSRGGRFKGGSTITMQTAKNVFLWTGKSYLRKVLEVPFSYWMEFLLGKRRILEIYLNVAEWGDGIFGIEAAARHYYGISAAGLGLDQAVSLSSVLPNPRIWSPVKPSPYIRVLREILRRRVLQAGAAT